MPIHTIRYQLPEEREEFELALNAAKYHSVLWDLDQALRSVVKYDQPLDVPGVDITTQQLVVEAVRDKLHALLNEEGITL